MFGETPAMQVYHPDEGLNIAADRAQTVTRVQRDLVVGLPVQPTLHDLSLVRLSPSGALHAAPRGYLTPFRFEVSTVALDGAHRDMKHLRQILLRGHRTLVQSFMR